MPVKARAWQLVETGRPLLETELSLPDPEPGDAIIEVDACGLCHTDLGFAEGGVAPRHALPLVLGHEITGRVVAAGSAHGALIGRSVLVPAVMPCGDCVFCRAGRGNACPRQKMPGNDIHGGFATHVVAPAHALVSLEQRPEDVALDALSVVADAVSTAYQATLRADLQSGDAAFIIGSGGVGGYLAQIARARGAKVIVADVDAERLEGIAPRVDHVVQVRERDVKDVRKEVFAKAKDWGIPSLRFRVFECSGTAPGQLQAYALVSQASTLVLVGFTRDPVNVRLSNLMAFDATVHGTWGCPLEAYPAVLKLIYDGKVELEPFIERAPLSRINDHLRALGEHRLSRRLVLNPRQ